MIYRNQYMNYKWSAVNVNQDLSGFTHFGWIKGDEVYEPFMTDKLCVPQSVSKLVICSCKMSVLQYVATTVIKDWSV